MVDSLLEIITDKGSPKFYNPIEVHFMTNAIDEIEVSMIFSYGYRNCCTMEVLRYLLWCKRNILIKPCGIGSTFF